MENLLTDAAIRKAKPRAKPYTLADGKGLHLLVNPNGSRWWQFRFTHAGKRRLMSFGVYPDVELGDARQERDRTRKLVAAGIDPIHERKRANSPDDERRFDAVARRWMEANRAAWSDRYYGIVKGRLERLVFPRLGQRSVASIEPTDVLEAMRAIEAEGSIDLCRRMHTLCGSIFRSAVAEGLAPRDPAADIRDALKKRPPVEHRASIRPDDMGAFLLKLDQDEDEEPDTIEALQLTILAATRTVETRFADRHEFEKLGTKNALWRIPKGRMKKNREHIIPLSRQADQLVRRRIAALRPGQNLLFGRKTVSGVISENTMLYALYRLGYHGRATVHGFRSTFSTHANAATRVDERGEEVRLWEPDWIEWALAHVEDNKVRGAYNAAEYLPQRRRLLQWWADWLDGELDLARLIG